MKPLIGRDPDQVPANGLLGKLAFLDSYGLIPLSEQTASNSTDITFDITREFDNYIIQANDVVLSNSAYCLMGRVYIDDAIFTSNYAYRLIEENSSGTSSGLNGDGVSQFPIIDIVADFCEFELRLRKPAGPQKKLIRWEGSRFLTSSTNGFVLQRGGAGIDSAGKITGISFYPADHISGNNFTAGGTISAGTFTLYGIMR